MAMTFFIIFATYSALMILVIPLGWYGYLNGIDPSPWNASAVAGLVRDRLQHHRAFELNSAGAGVDAGHVVAVC